MISLDDLVFVLGVEDMTPEELKTWKDGDDDLSNVVLEEDAFRFAVMAILDDAFGFERASVAMESFNPLADYIDVPIGCTKARLDLRPIRSAVAPLVRQAA